LLSLSRAQKVDKLKAGGYIDKCGLACLDNELCPNLDNLNSSEAPIACFVLCIYCSKLLLE